MVSATTHHIPYSFVRVIWQLFECAVVHTFYLNAAHCFNLLFLFNVNILLASLEHGLCSGSATAHIARVLFSSSVISYCD